VRPDARLDDDRNSVAELGAASDALKCRRVKNGRTVRHGADLASLPVRHAGTLPMFSRHALAVSGLSREIPFMSVGDISVGAGFSAV